MESTTGSREKEKEPKWLFFRRDTPQSEEFQKQVLLARETTTRTDLKISRERKGVKSNMVYKLCKDIVYTFGLRFECVWNPNGA